MNKLKKNVVTINSATDIDNFLENTDQFNIPETLNRDEHKAGLLKWLDEKYKAFSYFSYSGKIISAITLDGKLATYEYIKGEENI